MKKLDTNNREFYWIAIDIANTIAEIDGLKLDKLPLDDRVKWVVENFSNLKELAENGESPYETKNALNALRSHIRGERVNHMVYLDASNNALQLYAVLTGDLQTALTCNIAGGNVMADAYQMLADKMNPILEQFAKDNNAKKLVLNRSSCKKALMTTMYGKGDASTEIISYLYSGAEDEYQSAQQLCEEYSMTYAETKRGVPYADELSRIFKESIHSIAPKAIKTMDALVEINVMKFAPTYYWTLPDGFEVKCDIKRKSMTQQVNQQIAGFPDIVVSEVEYEEYGADFNSRALAPNVIHSVDAYVAREMIRRMDGRFITSIHDAFACHPLDCDDMIRNFNEIMAEILDSTLLDDIMTQLMGTEVVTEHERTLTKDMVLASTLALS